MEDSTHGKVSVELVAVLNPKMTELNQLYASQKFYKDEGIYSFFNPLSTTLMLAKPQWYVLLPIMLVHILNASW